MPHAPPLLALTDSELTAILHLAAPLPVALRDPFLRALATMAAGQPLGPGGLHRAARELQREFMTSPPRVEREPHSRRVVGTAIE